VGRCDAADGLQLESAGQAAELLGVHRGGQGVQCTVTVFIVPARTVSVGMSGLVRW